jgi:hypothetical protein
MVGQVYVHALPLPGQAAMPGGPDNVCNNETGDYMTTGASDAEDYLWVLIPAEAGELTPNGDLASIAWNSDFTGSAYLSVTGMNNCGEGTPSDDLVILVNAVPVPSVSGLDFICENEEADYSTIENTGSIYTWEVTGGTVTAGAGTWQVTVLWGYPGEGTVAVTEMTSGGCEAVSETLVVTIDDCTWIGEGKVAEARIFPNPATNEVHVTGLSDATVRIYNMVGKEMLSMTDLSGDKIINISTFDKGLYLVKVEQADGKSVFQLVKQ